MNFLKKELENIKNKGQYRELTYLKGSQNKYCSFEDKKVLLMASNNYLGLCDDERIKKVSKDAIDNYGVGSGGSRLTTGSYDVHKKLEEEIAILKNREAALLFNTGYMANIGVITSICNKEWIIFSDEFNHASIIDGCRLSGAKIVVYKHSDMKDLKQKVKLYKGAKRIIITDGVFSMDGDIVKLPEIIKISKDNDIWVMVDDAHATGILGEKGSGTEEYFGLKGQVDIQVGTLSKALASEGGYVAGSYELIEYLKNKARSFIYSTALSPIVVSAALKALYIIKKDNNLRKNLLNNSKWFQEELKERGFCILESETPIIPLLVGDEDKAMKFSKMLFEEGIFIPAIRPPSVPKDTSRLRITLMATHTKENLNFVLDKISYVFKKLK